MRGRSSSTDPHPGRKGTVRITVLEVVLGVACMGIVAGIAFSCLRAKPTITAPAAPVGAALRGAPTSATEAVSDRPTEEVRGDDGDSAWDDAAGPSEHSEDTPSTDGESADSDMPAEGDLYLSGEGGGERPAALDTARRQTEVKKAPQREQAERLASLYEVIASGVVNPKQIQNVMKGVEPEDIDAALAAIAGMEWGPQADALFQGLMSRWGQIEPMAALEYAAGLDARLTRNAAVKNALLSWGAIDPDAALAWLSSSPDIAGDTLGSSLRPFFSTLARSNPDWAFEHMWDLSDPKLQRMAVFSVIDSMSKTSDAASMSVLFERVSGDGRSLLAEALISAWTPYQPELAAEWTEALLGSESYVPAVDRLISSWGQNAPETAADWVMDLADPELRRRELSRLADAWVKTDPEATSEWLEQYPPSWDLDPAVITLVRATMKADPANAMTWADSITEPAKRRQLTYQVAEQWMRQDPAAATAYILASDMPQRQKANLLR